jgi:hypothetical protein
MPDLRLNAAGDLDVTNGVLSLTNDANGETTAQRVRTRLRLFKGEWFLDNTQGIDYFGQALVKNPDLAAVQSLIKNAILTTPGVLSIIAYTQALDPKTRVLAVSCTIQNDTGNILTVTGVLGA